MTNPLFVTDIATLKAQLRLSGVPTDQDAHVMVQSALMQVRAGFYTRLGISRVAELVAISPNANPTTEDGILRGIAEQLEVMWVRCKLLDRMPTVFMDSSGAYQEIMNQEGIARSLPLSHIEAQKNRCAAQVEEWLAILDGTVELGEAGEPNIATQGDQTPRVWPQGTLGGQNQRLFGDPTRSIEGEE